jgi:peroxidase
MLENQRIVCDQSVTYRTMDGTCNNLESKWWGKSSTPYQRQIVQEYDDNIGSVKRTSKVNGAPLPNPRSISLAVHYPVAGFGKNTNLFAMLGQNVGQDVLGFKDTENVKCSCAMTNNSDCSNVVTPPEDFINRDQACMTITRSEASIKSFLCDIKWYREQTNLATAWLDLSFVYGNTVEKSFALRKKQAGLLDSFFYAEMQQEYLTQEMGKCAGEQPLKTCFKSGSGRVNENMLAASISTLWMREHNRLARELAKLNPSYTDEQLFQEARRINIAQFQKIIYYDWIPLVVGDAYKTSFDFIPSLTYRTVYDDKTLPQTFNELSTAALRFGHSLVRSTISKVDENLNLISSISISEIIVKAAEAYKTGGINALIRGMLTDAVELPDAHLTDVVENHLFEGIADTESKRFSLSTFNINRGRDHGIAGYLKHRQMCGLNSARTFEELDNIGKEDIANLKKVYAFVADIDLFTGGISEKPLQNGVVGNTFACIISRFFYDLRKSDRFWYENLRNNPNGFTQQQLNNIKTVDIKSIICHNVPLARLQQNPFLMPDAATNSYVCCSNVNSVDLNLWTQQPTATPIKGFIHPFYQ